MKGVPVDHPLRGREGSAGRGVRLKGPARYYILALW